MKYFKKGVPTGVVAGFILVVTNYILNMLPGKQEFYADMFPAMMTAEGMLAMVLSIFLVGVFMGIIYSIVGKSIPGVKLKKGFNYGIMVWLLAGVMWPVMMMGFTDAYVWGMELISGFIQYTVTGVGIAWIYKKA